MYLQSAPAFLYYEADPCLCRKIKLETVILLLQTLGVKKKNGHKATIPLQFSKSGNPEIERAYATHYVDTAKVAQLKAAREDHMEQRESESDRIWEKKEGRC